MTRGSLGTAQLGRIGEELAGRALLDLGWRIRHRNLRAPEGELDLVGTDGEVTVVVEVKTGRRPPQGWSPARMPRHRFRSEALKRRQRAARRLARDQRGARGLSRVDLIEVQVDPGEPRPRLVHLRDLAARAEPWR